MCGRCRPEYTFSDPADCEQVFGKTSGTTLSNSRTIAGRSEVGGKNLATRYRTSGEVICCFDVLCKNHSRHDPCEGAGIAANRHKRSPTHLNFVPFCG